MNVELNLGELELIVKALDQKHDALSSGGTEVLPELRAVNKLYNRLRELTEEHERNHDLSLEEVHQGYARVRGRQLGSAVFISDLATELQIGFSKLHEWIHREVIKSGHGSLDDGHWTTATESQREAAIEHLGFRRLLIRFSQPDRAALIKEYDGQVKTLKIAKKSKEPRLCWLPRETKLSSSSSARKSRTNRQIITTSATKALRKAS
jgi:hypothetical protein